jgi:hypothetical protein
MTDEKPHVNFQAPATLLKWPSLNNRRRDDRDGLHPVPKTPS